MTADSRRIAFITYDELPNGHEAERAIFPFLEAAHLTSVPVVWNDPSVDWAAYEAVVFRTCWDYHLHSADFIALLDRLESLKVRAFNPVSTVRWNMNKSYLQTMAQRGVSVIPSVWLTQDTRQSLADVMDAQGWQEVVVKPMISAAAYLTERVTRAQADAAQAHLEQAIANGGAIVQRFMPEILDEGEWSVIFIDGAYSHSLIKRPKDGDFRVQSGIWSPAEPPAALHEAARALLATLDEMPLYARVDGVLHNGQFMLMELELIEPYLAFEQVEGSAERFAAALLTHLA